MKRAIIECIGIEKRSVEIQSRGGNNDNIQKRKESNSKGGEGKEPSLYTRQGAMQYCHSPLLQEQNEVQKESEHERDQQQDHGI